jgi:zinc protease
MTTATMRSWTAGLERRRLANGLTVLVHPDPTAPAVAVVIHVKAGFFDEPDHWQGISHVLEHMFFKGTPTRGVGQIAAETKGLGGYLNASTSYDATSYYVVLPATGFAQALAIQADALRNASIDAAELGRELLVIIEEAKRKLDTPAALAYETLHALLFDHHRIRRWRIGTETMLAGFTRDDVVGYYRSRYVPDRVIVSIAGAVDADEAFRAVAAAFDDWPRIGGEVDHSPEEPWRTGVRARTLTGDVRQADLALGWRGVAPLTPDAPPLDVAALVLSAGRGGWLYRAIRQPGLATSVGAYHYAPSEVGVFSVTMDLAPSDLGRAIEVLAEQIARLRTEGPSAADLARARTLLAAQWARRMEAVDGRATAYAAAEALGGFEVLDQEYARLMAVDAEQVRQAAVRYLGPDSLSAVAYLPPSAGFELTPEWLRSTFAAAASGPSSGVEPGASLPIRPGRPGSGRTKAGVTHLALPGIDLLLRPKAGAPLVTVGLYRRRLAEEHPAVAGVGALAVRAAIRGAGPFGAAELSEAFERLGGSVGAIVGADWFGVGASVLGEHAPAAARLMAEVYAAPRFERDEVRLERTTLREEARQAADDMFRYPLQLAFQAAFGDRSYGLPVKGTIDTLDRLDSTTVSEWFAAESGRVAVVVAGDVRPDLVARELAGAVHGLRASGQSSSGLRLPGRWRRREASRMEQRVKSQTALAMVFPGPCRTDPDRFAAEVLAAVASGLGGRLFTALRDRRSLAYTVLMSSWQRAGAGAIITYIATSPDREEEAREAILEELAALARGGVTESEVERSINYLAGQALVQRQTTGAIASELVDAWLVGEGLEELEDPTAGYRAVTRQAVIELAERYLDPERRAEGVVRGGLSPSPRS